MLRDVNALSDANVAVRRASLRRLGVALWGVDFSVPPGSSDAEAGSSSAAAPRTLTTHDAALLQGVWPDLMKPLLRRCADASEPCRLAAVRMVRACSTGGGGASGPPSLRLTPLD